MKKIINLSNNEKTLLTLIKSNQMPSQRQAYSDRMSWLMACLSEFAYEKFGIVNPASTKKLSDELKNYDISIEKVYDHEGTQALLLSTKQFLALAFRGTEATSLKDIKADLKFIMKRCPTNGRIHSGFSKAFEQVAKNIQDDLNKKKYAYKPLFITGHSLGGALATVASKRLTHKGGIAACYTFGSPRVGDEEWSYGLKATIYRVVNAVDCVTMLPPSNRITRAIKIVTGWRFFVEKVLQKPMPDLDGYFHVGDMRYLTNCKPNKYNDVKLTYAVSIWRRMQITLRGKSARKFIRDHKISIYREKLGIIALRRNKK